MREASDLSRESVAERAGISTNYLGEIERGEKWPTLDIVERIANALEVSPSSFFEYEAQEVDHNILLSKLHQLLSERSTDQLQQAMRILKAFFQM